MLCECTQMGIDFGPGEFRQRKTRYFGMTQIKDVKLDITQKIQWKQSPTCQTKVCQGKITHQHPAWKYPDDDGMWSWISCRQANIYDCHIMSWLISSISHKRYIGTHFGPFANKVNPRLGHRWYLITYLLFYGMTLFNHVRSPIIVVLNRY